MNDTLQEALARYIAKSGWVKASRPERTWWRAMSEAGGMLGDPAIRAALEAAAPVADEAGCLFGPPHEPFYCRIHADVRLRLTDERCRRGALEAAAPVADETCGECHGWPGHWPDCSHYGEPRTEAGARLLRTLEDTIYKGGLLRVGQAAIVAIEDEATHRARAAHAARPEEPPKGQDR